MLIAVFCNGCDWIVYCQIRFPFPSLHTNQMAQTTSAYPGFCSMKQLGVLLLTLDGMQVHHRLPPLEAFHQVSLAVHPYPFIHLGGESHCESKASCP